MRRNQRVLRLKDKYDRPILSGELNIRPFVANVEMVYALGEYGYRGIVRAFGLVFKVVSQDTYTWEIVAS